MIAPDFPDAPAPTWRRSTIVTSRTPRLASWKAVESPTIPAPTTTTSGKGEARNEDDRERRERVTLAPVIQGRGSIRIAPDPAPGGLLDHQRDLAVEVVLARLEVARDRKPGGRRSARAEMWPEPKREAPAGHALAQLAVRVELVGIRAEQLLAAVRRPDVQHDHGIGGDRDAPDLDVGLGTPLHPLRDRPQPQCFVDASGDVQPIAHDATALGLVSLHPREKEVEGVQEGLGARVGAALEIGRHLPDDPAVVLELQGWILAVDEQGRQDVLVGDRLEGPGAAMGLNGVAPASPGRPDEVPFELLERGADLQPCRLGILHLQEARAQAVRDDIDDGDDLSELPDVAVIDVEARPPGGEDGGDERRNRRQVDRTGQGMLIEHLAQQGREQHTLVLLEAFGPELGVLDAPARALELAVGGAHGAVAGVALRVGSRVETARELGVGQGVADVLVPRERDLGGRHRHDAAAHAPVLAAPGPSAPRTSDSNTIASTGQVAAASRRRAASVVAAPGSTSEMKSRSLTRKADGARRAQSPVPMQRSRSTVTGSRSAAGSPISRGCGRGT